VTAIDLNCDVGEGAGQDAELMPLISSANVACGAHAGDQVTMAETLRLAAENDVVAGAHPGFADRGNFGRCELNLSPAELRESVLEQLGALRAHGSFAYVKPHGALYNLAARDGAVARILVSAVRDFDATLGLLALAGSALWQAGDSAGLHTKAEAFADRAYDRHGFLVSRDLPGALLADATAAADQVLEMVTAGRVRSIDGNWVSLRPDSICLHGDNPAAIALARQLRSALESTGVRVRSGWR
jgi:5-oxoprolinase (ATP-hydrolysing) subunit A